MEHIVITVILAVLGLCMGSFAGATVWRLRGRQLVDESRTLDELIKRQKAGESLSENDTETLKELQATKTERTRESKRLAVIVKPVQQDYSRCLNCGHQLAWYDLIPLVSWLGTRGKCRYCHAFIGWFEPLMELGTAALFAGSYLLWPHVLVSTAAILSFVLWLVAVVMLVILFAYDLKWFLLPNAVVFPLMAVGAIMAVVGALQAANVTTYLLGLLGAAVILSGIYYVLWLVSKGRWIGFGDVKLGLALALLLGDWKLAFIALFGANLIGCLIVVPGMLAGKVSRTTRVPFGPLLIIGTMIAMLAGSPILDWYMSALI